MRTGTNLSSARQTTIRVKLVSPGNRSVTSGTRTAAPETA